MMWDKLLKVGGIILLLCNSCLLIVLISTVLPFPVAVPQPATSHLLWICCFILVPTATLFLLPRLFPEPAPMFGIYSQPGLYYPLKMATFWLILQLRLVFSHPDKASSDGAGYGVKSRSSIEEMEKVQPLGNHALAIDTVWFQGVSREGAWMVVGAARRHQNILEAVLLVAIPGLGTLKLPKHPDTRLISDPDEFGGEGLLVRPLEPMKKWRIYYSGKMRLQKKSNLLPREDGLTGIHPDYEEPFISHSQEHSEDNLVDVVIDLTYASRLKYFDFDTDQSPITVARAMATETWTREFFQHLQDAHQTHYEQIGTTSGVIKVNDTTYSFSVTGMRDHTYAKRRDWSLLHRYALHTMVLKDGTSAQVGIVCQPYNFSRFELGYVFTPDGQLHPLDWCDFQLGYHGENGDDPCDYGFSFCAGGKTYNVLVKVQDRHVLFQGHNWEAKLLERPCRYTVNGMEGWGMSEWYYKHSGGKPQKHPSQDWEWVKVASE